MLAYGMKWNSFRMNSLHMFSIEHWCASCSGCTQNHTLCARDPILTNQPTDAMPCHGMCEYYKTEPFAFSFSDEMKWNEMLQSCSTFIFQLILIIRKPSIFSFHFISHCFGYFHFDSLNFHSGNIECFTIFKVKSDEPLA